MFSLGGWSPQLPTRLHVSRGTQDPDAIASVVLYGTLTRSGHAFQRVQVTFALADVSPTTPSIPKDRWFGLLPVRSPLLRESRLISFRRVTEMFQFTRFPLSPPMCSAGSLQTSLWRSCLIRILGVHRLHAAPPERFAGLRVLLRFSAPRHPPRTLCSLFFLAVILIQTSGMLP